MKLLNQPRDIKAGEEHGTRKEKQVKKEKAKPKTKPKSEKSTDKYKGAEEAWQGLSENEKKEVMAETFGIKEQDADTTGFEFSYFDVSGEDADEIDYRDKALQAIKAIQNKKSKPKESDKSDDDLKKKMKEYMSQSRLSPHEQNKKNIMEFFRKNPNATFQPFEVGGDGRALERAALELRSQGLIGNKGPLGFGLKKPKSVPKSVKPGGLKGLPRTVEAQRHERNAFSKIWSKIPTEKKFELIKENAGYITDDQKKAENIKGFERDQVIKGFQQQGLIPPRKEFLKKVDAGEMAEGSPNQKTKAQHMKDADEIDRQLNTERDPKKRKQLEKDMSKKMTQIKRSWRSGSMSKINTKMNTLKIASMKLATKK
jgi:hypothetical protein